MQPENSIRSAVACDLSECSFYYALEQIDFIPPEITLTINPKCYYSNIGSLPLYNLRVRIVFDHLYKLDEWSVSCNGRTCWSPGA
jgi:hypothetical protein